MVGLTCAVQLAEAGHQVDVLARDLPGETASSIAAAPWLPPPVRLGEDAARWALTTREVLTALADSGPDRSGECGVRMMAGRLLPSDGSAPAREQLELPVVSPVPYLRGLTRRLMRARGTLTRMALPVLPGPTTGYVVNCTGVAARALAPDPLVLPRTRRLVRLVDPGLEGWTALIDPGGECRLLIVPDGHTVTVSGDDVPAAELMGRAAAVEPGLATTRVLGERTAVRADRTQVRVGNDSPAAGTALEGDGTAPANRSVRVDLLHNYGHGGSGLSLSWGCAREVESLLAATPLG